MQKKTLWSIVVLWFITILFVISSLIVLLLNVDASKFVDNVIAKFGFLYEIEIYIDFFK